jgi:DNA-binding FrmR family transcriptional regulator
MPDVKELLIPDPSTILGTVCQGGLAVAHTVEEKKELLIRVNRIQGQLQSIKESIEKEKECADVLQQIAACRGAMGSLLAEIIEGEIRFHVLTKNTRANSREMKAAQNLVQILHRYIK